MPSLPTHPKPQDLDSYAEKKLETVTVRGDRWLKQNRTDPYYEITQKSDNMPSTRTVQVQEGCDPCAEKGQYTQVPIHTYKLPAIEIYL